ncbi:MAG: ribonuclease E/G, partial [Acidimicrobiales bacterium]|nr:ribonuclease E/G [Acidimicrobiales bacterium]
DAPTPDAAGGGDQGRPDGGDQSGGAAASGNRRRGSRGGRGRKPGGAAAGDDRTVDASASASSAASAEPDELPDRLTRNTIQDPAVAEQALVRKPRIGDTRPAPVAASGAGAGDAGARASGSGTDGDPQRQRSGSSRRRRGGRGRGKAKSGGGGGGGGASSPDVQPVQAIVPTEAVELDEAELELRRGRERKGKPVGRYLMVVSVRDQATQIAVLEGRNLVEHYVSRPADDVFQIHGNIYLGKVQNVLPGMEAAFVDIATPKNAVLYRGDVQYDREDIEEPGEPKIEQILKPRQTVLCQVTKNPIAHKGARLTQEVSLPGRFVVLIPNSKTYGISKRLPDNERKRLRQVLDRV